MSEEKAEYNIEAPNMTATEVILRQVIHPLQAQINNCVNLLTNQEAPEPQHDKLFAALAEAQKKITNAQEDASAEVRMKAGGTYGYSYATLASVMDAVRGPLAENGLSIIQLTADPGEGKLGIRTILAHESGQSITDVITMAPDSWTPQAVGSCRSYMRRYAVLAICSIAGALDDDAEAASPDPDEYDRISKVQTDEILVLAENLFGKSADAVVDRMLAKVFELTSVKDIPADLFDQAKTLLENQAKREKKATKPKPKSDKEKLAEAEKSAEKK